MHAIIITSSLLGRSYLTFNLSRSCLLLLLVLDYRSFLLGMSGLVLLLSRSGLILLLRCESTIFFGLQPAPWKHLMPKKHLQASPSKHLRPRKHLMDAVVQFSSGPRNDVDEHTDVQRLTMVEQRASLGDSGNDRHSTCEASHQGRSQPLARSPPVQCTRRTDLAVSASL